MTDGTVFAGVFSDFANGRGVIRYADGDIFEGRWKDGKKQGLSEGERAARKARREAKRAAEARRRAASDQQMISVCLTDPSRRANPSIPNSLAFCQERVKQDRRNWAEQDEWIAERRRKGLSVGASGAPWHTYYRVIDTDYIQARVRLGHEVPEYTASFMRGVLVDVYSHYYKNQESICTEGCWCFTNAQTAVIQISVKTDYLEELLERERYWTEHVTGHESDAIRYLKERGPRIFTSLIPAQHAAKKYAKQSADQHPFPSFVASWKTRPSPSCVMWKRFDYPVIEPSHPIRE